MIDLFLHRNTAVWAALVGATCGSLALGSVHGAEAATAAVLAIAFGKVRYVGLEFMELRGAATPLRIAFEAYVVLVGAIISGLYLLA